MGGRLPPPARLPTGTPASPDPGRAGPGCPIFAMPPDRFRGHPGRARPGRAGRPRGLIRSGARPPAGSDRYHRRNRLLRGGAARPRRKNGEGSESRKGPTLYRAGGGDLRSAGGGHPDRPDPPGPGTRRPSDRHHATGRRRAGERNGLGRGRQGRWSVVHSSGTIVAESSSEGRGIECTQTVVLNPPAS